MPSLSPKLPLNLDPELGYQMNKTLIEVIRQNLKMILLTSPGERVMIPEFGVGLKRYLFENISPSFKDSIEQKIREQVATYMPSVFLESILFDESEMNSNKMYIGIAYSVPSAGIMDTLLMPVNADAGAY